MMVPSRAESGQWRKWRVGRRRLAWLPGAGSLQLLQMLGFADGPLFLPVIVLVAVPALGWFLLTWTAALLATAVVWPRRRIVGRWPVVAYRLDNGGDDDMVRVWVDGREAADALARQWEADIKRDGRPRIEWWQA